MIGAGYVGLVSATCFSEFGWTVTCIDKDPSKIEHLRQGGVPIYEPRLDELLHRNLRMGRIAFSSDLAPSVGGADLVFLAVGTPMRRGDGHADLSFVFQAVEELAPHLKGFTVICTKSTVPVGTSREIERRLKGLRPDADFAVCSNPEFLLEGSAIYDFMHPDRVLVGCDADRRIGDKFLHPGPGYGGSCFPKDVAALIRTAREARSPLSLIEQVQTVNTERKIAMASRIERAAGGKLAGKSVAVRGVTFKPDTDDVRDAPSLTLIPMLQEKGASVRAYDPHARENAEELLPGVIWCGSALEAAEKADIAVVVTEWNEFRALDLNTLKGRMRGDVLVDLRNIYLPAQARAAGFNYTSVGR